MSRRGLWLLLLFAACPARAPEALLLDRFEVTSATGTRLGEVSLHRVGAGRMDAASLEAGDGGAALQISSQVERGEEGLRYRSERLVGRDKTVVTVEPKGEGVLEWTRRKGLVIERRRIEGAPELLVDLPDMPDDAPAGSLATWADLLARAQVPRRGGIALRVLNARTGRVQPMRIQVRGEKVLRLGDADVEALRLFAWTPGSGHTLWVGADGRLLSVGGLWGAGHVAVPGLVIPAPHRPERPEHVSAEAVRTEAPGVHLAGTLTRPEGDAKLPLVLLIHGSGPMDRDESIPGLPYGLFRDLAYRLGREEVAVLRWDKRGVGESVFTGEARSTLEDLAADVRAWIRFAETREDLDAAQVFLIGHSEGAYIAPVVALEEPGVRGLVFLAGPVSPMAGLLRVQGALIGKAHGLSEPELAKVAEGQDMVLRLIATGRDRELTLPGLTDVSTEWLRSHLAHDPRPLLARLELPLLALFGEADLQVPPTEAAVLREALAGRPDVEIEVVPGLDHLLMRVEALPGMGAYVDPDRTPAAPVLDRVARWIGSRAQGK